MTTFTGITDDITILVFSHKIKMGISRIMRIFYEKSISFSICFCDFVSKKYTDHISIFSSFFVCYFFDVEYFYSRFFLVLLLVFSLFLQRIFLLIDQ